MVDSHVETKDAGGPPPGADEPALRAAIEDFFFGFRAFTALPDELLATRGLGRTHHRILYFVRRSPGVSVGELLDILGITKQAAHRPLADLQRAGLLTHSPAPDDRRVRRLAVTDAGRALEAELSGVQMRLLAESFAEAGPDAEAGWRHVMGVLRARLGTP